MKQLKLGIISSEELADWFGIKYDTYRHSKAKKLAILEKYCRFKEVPKKGVEILELYHPDVIEYSKARDRVEKLAKGNWKIDTWRTARQVNEDIFIEDPVLSSMISFETSYNYVCCWKRMEYGVAYVRHGRSGRCVSQIVKIGPGGELIEFTPEEKQIKNKLIKKYFGTDDEKEYIILEEFRAGNCTGDEVAYALLNIKNHTEANVQAFLTELKKALGPTAKATKLINETYFEDDQN